MPEAPTTAYKKVRCLRLGWVADVASVGGSKLINREARGKIAVVQTLFDESVVLEFDLADAARAMRLASVDARGDRVASACGIEHREAGRSRRLTEVVSGITCRTLSTVVHVTTYIVAAATVVGAIDPVIAVQDILAARIEEGRKVNAATVSTRCAAFRGGVDRLTDARVAGA